MLCVQANIKEGFSRQRKNKLKKQKNNRFLNLLREIEREGYNYMMMSDNVE